ncbi:oxygenase MpaB family protein [Allokutzneria oryzae]|uniref:Oxygenase MpaB family protein n=1 Tax=Allokutzneria oryzae TaxID=1378989 RepID=A0ABV5ZP25_9PSEU
MAVDPGLFGPNSVTWNLHGDPAMWLGGIGSLFLQALHPRAVAGIVQNSIFRSDPLGRLERTASFVSLSTYGTHEQVHAAAAHVRRVHSALKGRDQDTGERFPVDDPELLLWVHCAEVASFASVTVRAGFPATRAHLDRYFLEQRRSAELVGLSARDVPGSVGEMADYFTAMKPQLRCTPDADIVYEFLHLPPMPRWLRLPVRHGYQPLGHLSYSLLPDWAIRLYDRPAYSEERATSRARTFRDVALLIPKRLRWSVPSSHALAAVRRLGRAATPSPALLPR